jgi:ABC-2 type transport system ATP-binding protein
VAAFASNVELLLLDEPTLGLDPLMEEVFREFVLEERRRGRTIFLSSHILAEVEALCDRVTIIRNGKAIESGTLAELRHLTRTSISADLSKPPSGLERIAGVSGLSIKGNHVNCEVDNLNLNALIVQLTQAGLLSLVSQPPTLEDLFLHYYAREKGADEKIEAAQ